MTTRPAAVAGLFYPAQPEQLQQQLDQLLTAATHDVSEQENYPKALIVPHAGYIYSGAVAAAAYATLPTEMPYRQILLLGPPHRMAVTGMAVPSTEAFATPLGEYPLACSSINALVAAGLLQVNDPAHALEHSLEVQLPFLQQLLLQRGIAIPLIPVLVGRASTAEVAQLITACCQQAETLVIVSSDLSHFHRWEQARRIDLVTTRQIESLDGSLLPEQACGCSAINGLLYWLGQQGWPIRCLRQCNSGDVAAGDKQRVVGYGAYAVYA